MQGMISFHCILEWVLHGNLGQVQGKDLSTLSRVSWISAEAVQKYNSDSTCVCPLRVHEDTGISLLRFQPQQTCLVQHLVHSCGPAQRFSLAVLWSWSGVNKHIAWSFKHGFHHFFGRTCAYTSSVRLFKELNMTGLVQTSSFQPLSWLCWGEEHWGAFSLSSSVSLLSPIQGDLVPLQINLGVIKWGWPWASAVSCWKRGCQVGPGF